MQVRDVLKGWFLRRIARCLEKNARPDNPIGRAWFRMKEPVMRILKYSDNQSKNTRFSYYWLFLSFYQPAVRRRGSKPGAELANKSEAINRQAVKIIMSLSEAAVLR